MAQGNTKGLKGKTASGGRKKTGQTKKGRREIAPKKIDVVREKMTKKVGTSGNGMLMADTLGQDQQFHRKANGQCCQFGKIDYHEE